MGLRPPLRGCSKGSDGEGDAESGVDFDDKQLWIMSETEMDLAGSAGSELKQRVV